MVFSVEFLLPVSHNVCSDNVPGCLTTHSTHMKLLHGNLCMHGELGNNNTTSTNEALKYTF